MRCSDALRLMRLSVGCTTNTSESEFSVHTLALDDHIDRLSDDMRLVGVGASLMCANHYDAKREGILCDGRV